MARRKTCTATCVWEETACEYRKGWQSIALPPAGLTARRLHRMFWTGDEVIVFGGQDSSGQVNNGARFNPGTNSWTLIPAPTAEAVRSEYSVVWTGSELLLWGGLTDVRRNDGLSHNPASKNWWSIPAAPIEARSNHAAVWTGTEMVVWGGTGETSPALNDGAAFNPSTGTWRVLPSAPIVGRAQPLAAVRKGRMLIWGGDNHSGALDRSGAEYDPFTNSWTPIPEAPLPARLAMSWATTDSGFVLGGGVTLTLTAPYMKFIPDVLRLDESTWDEIAWPPTSIFPQERLTGAGWSDGKRVYFWSGPRLEAGKLKEMVRGGAAYDPTTKSWTVMSPKNEPSPRSTTAVWAGRTAMVWGGASEFSGGGVELNDGAIYTP